MQERDRALSEMHTRHETELGAIRERQEHAGEQFVGKLEEQAERARNFMNIVTSTGTQGAYQDRADKDEKQAQIYRAVAMVLGVAAVALAVVLFLVDDRDNPLAKLGVVTTAFGVAGLVWNHAARKQTTAEGRREQALKLASFQAVLDILPDEQVAEQICWFFQQQYARDTEPGRRRLVADAVAAAAAGRRAGPRRGLSVSERAGLLPPGPLIVGYWFTASAIWRPFR